MPSPFPGMDPYLEQEEVWEGYRHYIYEGLPKPPLSEADQAWAAALARHA